MLLFAVSRWPGLLPPNFSAVYALVFCAGVYFPKRMAWWLPLATMVATDVALNIYYHRLYGSPLFHPELLGNYAVYIGLIWVGRKFTPEASFLKLVCGGVLGAIVFYFVSNTVSWFFNIFNAPEYTKTLTGWLIALTRGMADYPFPIKMQTWEMFRNTLASGGLFTGLFVGAMKLLEALAPEEEEETKEEEAPDEQPEEAKA